MEEKNGTEYVSHFFMAFRPRLNHSKQPHLAFKTSTKGNIREGRRNGWEISEREGQESCGLGALLVPSGSFLSWTAQRLGPRNLFDVLLKPRFDRI